MPTPEPEQPIRSTDPILPVIQTIRVVQPVQPVVIRHDVTIQPAVSIPSRSKLADFVESNVPAPESKKEFEKPAESKKEFDSPKDDLEFDMDADVGRWRTDEQVKELVMYRYEWKQWPEDVEDKINHPTGLESYYELRYFKEGTNRKGERYADLYKKHRAKRDLWIDDYCASQALVDVATPESNVVSFARRAGAAH